jgi:hypothetical protein
MGKVPYLLFCIVDNCAKGKKWIRDKTNKYFIVFLAYRIPSRSMPVVWRGLEFSSNPLFS